MHDLDVDPVLWLGEFATGLLVLFWAQILTGCWTIFVIYSSLPSHLKLPACVTGVCALSIASSRIFDPATHILGSVVAAVSMSFTAPLQAAAWVRIKTANPSEATPAYAVVLRIAIPAALPNARYPTEGPLVQIARGSAYLVIAVLTRPLFQPMLKAGGVGLDVLGAVFVMCVATGALNITSAILAVLGAPSPSPFRRPLLSPSLARFWAGRWNAPVSDALRVAIYDPLRKSYGYSPGVSAMACFLASGVAHELVLLYCGVRTSRGEWFCFFILSGVATLVEKKVHRFLQNGLARYTFAVVVFCTLYHFLFLPVTIRTGFAEAGVRAIGTGPVLVDYLYKKLF